MLTYCIKKSNFNTKYLSINKFRKNYTHPGTFPGRNPLAKQWSWLSGETLTASNRRTVGAWFSPDGEALLQALVDWDTRG